MILLQAPGLTEFEEARNQLSSSFLSALDCSLVLAFIIGIAGAIRIHHDWNMGKRDIATDIAAWGFAALFVVLSGVFLRAVFGL